MIEIKNSMEEVLYSQFILILNTKKRKIRELQEEIKSLKRKIENSVYDQSTDTETSDEEGEKTKDLKENKMIITEIVEDTKKPDLKGKDGTTLKAKSDTNEIIKKSATVNADILNPKPSTSKQSDISYERVISSPPDSRKSSLDDRFAKNVGADLSEISRESETVTAEEISNPQPSTSKHIEEILNKEVIDSPQVSRKSSLADGFEVGDYEFISSPPVSRKSPLGDEFVKNVGADPSEINREFETVTADEILNPQPSTSKQCEEFLNKEVIDSPPVSRKSPLDDGFEVGDYEFDDIINEVINVQPTASKREAENSSDEISASPAKIPRQTSEFAETDDEDFELKDEGDSFEKANIDLTHLNITDVEPEEDLFSESF